MIEKTPEGSAAALLALGIGAGDDSGIDGEFDLAEFLCACPDLELAGCLGRGGMGVVYRARQVRLDRHVAVKLMNPQLGQDPEFAERFEREARAMARLQHPGIVAVHDFGEAAGVYYIVMELVDGPNLRQLMHEAIAPDEASDIVGQLCDALAYAHLQGVVHRDIKPENVLIDRQGRVRVADFGLAKLQRERADGFATRTRRVLGTVQYMAPEQLRDPGSVDHRSDIFAIGVVFYEMLTGQLPVGRFELPSELARSGSALDDIVVRALEANRERRFQAASEIRAALSELQAPTTQTDARPRAGSRWAWVVGGAAAAGASVVAWGLDGDPKSEDPVVVDQPAAVDVGASPRLADAEREAPAPLDRWPATELALLDAATVGVVGLDWSELRQAPAIVRIGGAALEEFRNHPELNAVCNDAIVDGTHKILVGTNAQGRPLEAILHADWTVDELETCIRGTLERVGKQGDARPSWSSEALGPYRKITITGEETLEFAIAKRGPRIAVTLADFSEARLESILDGTQTSADLRGRVVEALDLAAPLWVFVEPEPGELPLEMTAFFGTLELWDRVSVDAVAQFPSEASAAAAKKLIESYANIIASLPDVEEAPTVTVERVGSSLHADANMLVPEFDAAGTVELNAGQSFGLRVDMSK